MLEVISLLGVVKNYLPHPAPGPFGLLATLQLSCQTAPENKLLQSVRYAIKDIPIKPLSKLLPATLSSLDLSPEGTRPGDGRESDA